MAPRILVAEDDAADGLALLGHLAGLGQVDLAMDGQEAVQTVLAALGAGQPYDLIFLDLALPSLPGRAALGAIRALEAHNGRPPGQGARIILTGAPAASAGEDSPPGPAGDAFLAKPISREGLLATLAALGLLARQG